MAGKPPTGDRGGIREREFSTAKNHYLKLERHNAALVAAAMSQEDAPSSGCSEDRYALGPTVAKFMRLLRPEAAGHVAGCI
jgi:hypothetical protein